MRTVIFIGMEQLAGKIDFESGGQLRAIYKSDPESALQVMAATPPDLIVINAGFDKSGPVDFVSMTRTCYPELRVPIILVDLTQPLDDAVINEYDAQSSSFVERLIPPKFLKNEIRRACGLEQPEEAELNLDQVREIGRNEYIKRGEKNFNVQTEVIAGETLKIKTMIFDKGVLLDSTVKSLHLSEKDIINKLTKIAGSQHYEAVAKVRRGEYD